KHMRDYFLSFLSHLLSLNFNNSLIIKNLLKLTKCGCLHNILMMNKPCLDLPIWFWQGKSCDRFALVKLISCRFWQKGNAQSSLNTAHYPVQCVQLHHPCGNNSF